MVNEQQQGESVRPDGSGRLRLKSSAGLVSAGCPHSPFTIRLVVLAAVLAPLPVLAMLPREPQGRGGAAALAEPFKGVTTGGTAVPGLFPITASGVSTAPVRQAAERFLAALTPEHRQKTTFPVDDAEWRDWNNVHRYALAQKDNPAHGHQRPW